MRNVFKLLNFILVMIMIIGSLIFGIYYIMVQKYIRVFSCFSIIGSLGIPLLIKNTRFKLSDKEYFSYFIFIFLAHFLGSIINFYKYIEWYDIFIHFISGFVTSYMAHIILKKSGDYSFKNNLINFIFILGFVSLVAVSWEVVEFIGDIILNSNFQHHVDTGVFDTMCDMIVALIAGIVFYFYKKDK